MNTQQAYEQMVKYFSRDGAVIAWDDEEDRCAYRNASGDKCAVGCLIPDELYLLEFEGKGIWQLYDFKPIADLFAGVTDRFLMEAQDAHDAYATSTDGVSGFLRQLHKIADRFDLST